jgi:hypothetical protein
MRWRGPGTWSRFLLFPNVPSIKYRMVCVVFHGHAFNCVPTASITKLPRGYPTLPHSKRKMKKMLNLDGRQLLLE